MELFAVVLSTVSVVCVAAALLFERRWRRADLERRAMRAAILRIVGRRADDVCWRDAYAELAGLVGRPFNPELIGDPEKMLANCRRFVYSLHNGGPYVPVYVERNPACDAASLPPEGEPP